MLLNIDAYELNHIKYSTVLMMYLIASVFIVNFITALEKSEQAKFFFLLFVLCSTAWGALFMLFLLGLHVPNRDDFAGFFQDRNTYSIAVVLLLTIVRFGYWSLYTSNQKLLFICGGVLLLTSVVISRSLTGTFLSAYFLFFALFKRISIKTVIFGGALFLLGVGVAIHLDLKIVYRASRFIIFFTSNSEILVNNESAFVRPFMIKQGFKILEEYALFGVGMDNARFYYQWPTRDTGSYLHNNYLDVATSLGVFGFIAYYFPLFAYLLKARHRLKNDFVVAGVHLIVMKLLYDLTYTNYSDFFPVFTIVLACFFIGRSSKSRGIECSTSSRN